MCEFAKRQPAERDYEAFLRAKIELSRASMRAGRGLSNEEVEAAFAGRRTKAPRNVEHEDREGH